MHFALGAYFELHFRQIYHVSMLNGPWLDCFHQKTGSILSHTDWWYKRHRLKTNIEMKQTANDKSGIVDTSQGDRTIIVPSPWGYRRMTVLCPYDFMGHVKALCDNLAGSLRLSQESTIIFGPRLQSKTLRCPQDRRAVPVRGSYDVTAMCLRATGLRFFQICHCAEFNKIVEATMPVNPYDDCKVSLRRPHGNGDSDIVRASYTRCKANVTEALFVIF